MRFKRDALTVNSRVDDRSVNMRSNGRPRLVIRLLAATVMLAAAGCGETIVSNLVWFEATATDNAEVVSQGPGRALQLTCVTVGNGNDCRWTVRMLLRSAEAFTGWSLDLLGDSGQSLTEVTGFTYMLTAFTTAAGGELFGPEPGLLTGTGATTAAAGGVAPGSYVLLEFELVYDNPVVGPEERSILAVIGADGWTVLPDPEDQVPPILQIGSNLPFPVLADSILPEPVIVIDLPRPGQGGGNGNGDDDDGDDDDNDDDDDDDDDDDRREFCGDGIDNDGDGRVDCDDSQCANHQNCSDDPTITCPADLTLECDGLGNVAAVDAWLADIDVDSECSGLEITDDFVDLDNPCGAAGTALVTWRVRDACGRDSCSARLNIRDSLAPVVTAPTDLTFACDPNGPHTELRNWLQSATAVDACGDTQIVASRGATTFNCTGAVVWTATDECGNRGTDTAQLTISGDTGVPTSVLNGAAAVTLECGVETYVELGTTVSDDCDLTLTTPTIGGALVDAGEPGVYVVTYDASDLCGNAALRVSRTVTVVDTRAPRVELIPIELRPPNHDYVTLNLSDCAEAVDDCERGLPIDAFGIIVSVRSNEPDNGNGDGNTENDAIIVDDNTFRVRAERQGGGDGRIYTVTFDLRDSAGRVGRHECFVDVPHDQGHSNGGDDDNDDDDDDDD